MRTRVIERATTAWTIETMNSPGAGYAAPIEFPATTRKGGDEFERGPVNLHVNARVRHD